MILRVLAMLMFAAGTVLLLFSTFAMDSLVEKVRQFAVYSGFFSMVLWAIGAIFIIMSRSAMDKIRIGPSKW